MSAGQLNDGTRAFVQALFEQTDAQVAHAIAADKLHRGTALFVLKQFVIEVEKIDQDFGAKLAATHCEEAVRPIVFDDGVYTRPECIFTYCPSPADCRASLSGCRNPRAERTSGVEGA